MRNKLITALFVLLLAAGTLALILVPDKYYSETEKRTLKRFPEVSWTNVKSGKFGDDFEGYLEDQFPARNSWVTTKTFAERALGKKENNGVYFAKDGYLIEIKSPDQLTALQASGIPFQKAETSDGKIIVKVKPEHKEAAQSAIRNAQNGLKR